MALTAAIATAVAAVFAVAALGGAGSGGVLLPPLAVAVALLPGLFLVGTRPERRVLEQGRDLRLLMILSGAGALIWYVTSQSLGAGGLTSTARLAILAVVPLSLLWPAPTVVRYCLLLGAAAIAAAGSSPSQTGWPLAGLAASSAVALVALNRQASTSALGGIPTTGASRRRIAGEATVLLVIAGMAGLILASLLPPPKSSGSPETGEEPGGQGATTSAYLNPGDRLDAGGKGSGRGNQVLLRITAPAPALWRAQTFDRWDGRSWTRTAEIERGIGDSPGRQPGQFAFVPPGVGDGLSGGEPFVQRVRVEAASAGVLVAAPRAYTLQLARGQVQAAGDGTVRAFPPLGKGATYAVTSVQSRSTDDDLRSDAIGSVPTEVARPYLQLPADLPAPVRAMAAEITAGAATSFDGIRAVEEWLANNTQVAPDSPSLAPGVDPIEQFLFTDRKGSAEQAASSMAVMLRTLGIPARLAVGFLPGDRYRLGGEFVVRARHGHAWVEAWFPQAGWVAFDPSGRAPDRADADSLLDRLRRLLGDLWWVLAVAMAVMVRWLTLRSIRRWQRRRARPWVSRCYERLVRAGLRGGRPLARHETPAEYCAALADVVADDRLIEVGRMITRGAYSNDEPPPPDRAWADRVVRDTGRRSHRHRPPRGDPDEHLQSVGSSDA